MYNLFRWANGIILGNYLQGVYRPDNPQKYKGDVKNIVYRSSWELAYLRRLDTDPNVLQYSSEEIVIAYFNPVKQRVARYFMDFWVKYKDPTGNIIEELVEIKPMSQRKAPISKPGKRRKTLITEQMTWATNQAKWEAATKYCAIKGWKFRIISEKELGISR